MLAGDAGFALLGSDKWDELPEKVARELCFEPVLSLPCRFVLAAPSDVQLTKDDGIATSYPVAWRRFAQTNGYNCQLTRVMKGKVESAPARGLAKAIYDITETGRSLKENDLEIKMDGPPLALGGLWRRTSA